MLIVSIVLAIWIPIHYHRNRWERYTELSVPKSQWGEKSPEYRWFAKEGFTCLDNLNSEFVDFRSWRNEGAEGEYWTIWRTPNTKNVLDAHLDHFELTKHALSDEMTVFLYRNMPLEWVLGHDTEFEVYQPKSQPEYWSTPQLEWSGSFEEEEYISRLQTEFIPDRCRFLLHDIKNNVIYFYTMTKFRIRWETDTKSSSKIHNGA